MKRFSLLAAGVILWVSPLHGQEQKPAFNPPPGREQAINTNDWPKWRGPNADGIADGRKLPVQWSQARNIIW